MLFRSAKLAQVLHTTPAFLMGWDDTLPPGAIPYVPGKKIPIIGVIPAGDPLLATEEIEGYAFADVPDPENYFFLRVRGSSMTPGISSGDLVFVRRQSCADNGQIVVALVNGDEATLKRFRQQGQSVILMPDNPDFTPYMLTADDFTRSYARIIGVVVELRRTI